MISARITRPWDLLMGLALIVSAMAKIASGHDPKFMVGPLLFFGSATLELAIGAMFLSKRALAVACGLTLGLCLVGLALGALYVERPCGCLGVWITLSPRAHLLTASAMGSLAAARLASLQRRGKATPAVA